MREEKTSYPHLHKKLSDYFPVDLDAMNALKKILTVATLDKDEYLSKIYENKRQIGFLLDGIIRAYYLKENGTEYNKNFFTEDDLFMTSLDKKRDASIFIQTITECSMIVFDYEDFEELTKKYSCLEKAFNKILLEYMQKKQQREIELLTLDAKDRYVHFLKNHADLVNKLPQYHIASYLGITPTQLSRISKSLQ